MALPSVDLKQPKPEGYSYLTFQMPWTLLRCSWIAIVVGWTSSASWVGRSWHCLVCLGILVIVNRLFLFLAVENWKQQKTSLPPELEVQQQTLKLNIAGCDKTLKERIANGFMDHLHINGMSPKKISEDEIEVKFLWLKECPSVWNKLRYLV